MRVLVWSFRLLPTIGGQELLVRDLVNGLVDRGHTVNIIGPALGFDSELHTHEGDEVNFRPGVVVHRLTIREAFERRDLRGLHRLRLALAEITTAFVPDVIHMHGTGPDAFLYLSSDPSVRAIPMLFTCHGMVDEFRAGEESSTAKLLDAATRISAVSQSTLREILGWAPWAADKASVVHNGVQIANDDVEPVPDSQRFLSASRLAPEKGLAVLVSSFAILAERCPRATLVLAGGGPLLNQLSWLACRLGVAGRVEFPGWLDRPALQDEFRRATAVVVPSTWAEPFGLIAAEAGASGRPVIASRTGGLTEVVVDGETGLLVQPGDIIGLADAMSRLIDDPISAQAYGRQARTRIAECFSWERCIDSFERLLNETAGRAR